MRPSFHLLQRLHRGCTHVRHTVILASSCTHEHPRFRACLAWHSIPRPLPARSGSTHFYINHVLVRSYLCSPSSFSVSDFLPQTPGKHTFAVGLFMFFCYQLYSPSPTPSPIHVHKDSGSLTTPL